MERYAVIVGVNDYDDPEFEPLHFAEADARDFAKLLVGPEGEWAPDHVHTLIGRGQVTGQTVRSALARIFLQQRIPSDSLILFYFSGHAFLDGRQLQGYLAFPETRQDDPVTGLSMSEVLEYYVKPARADNVLVILDSCHSGAIWNQLMDKGEADADSSPLGAAELEQMPVQGRVILASCRANQRSREDASRSHGIFTAALLEGWHGGRNGKALDAEKVVTVDSLFGYLHRTITAKTQRPQRFGQQEGVLVLNGSPLAAVLIDTSLPDGSELDIGILPDYLAHLRLPNNSRFIGYTKRGQAFIEPATVVVPKDDPDSPFTFRMGSDAAELQRWPDRDKDSDEYSEATGDKRHSPLHIETFRIGVFPVTVAEYRCFVEAVDAQPQPEDWEAQCEELSNPVVHVSWNEAKAYCTWLSGLTTRPYRLATEAEWEKAARWDEEEKHSRVYPWGDDWEITRCNTAETLTNGLERVGTRPSGASRYGVQDLSGNVWEWTSSLKLPYPYDARDGRESFDQQGARVVRGGSWIDGYAYNSRAAYRAARDPHKGYDDVGFRVARSSS